VSWQKGRVCVEGSGEGCVSPRARKSTSWIFAALSLDGWDQRSSGSITNAFLDHQVQRSNPDNQLARDCRLAWRLRQTSTGGVQVLVLVPRPAVFDSMFERYSKINLFLNSARNEFIRCRMLLEMGAAGVLRWLLS
jgi:hypothetical protein